MGRGGKVFLFSLSAPSPSPFDSPQLVRSDMAVSTRGLSVQITLAHPTKMPAMQGNPLRVFTR